MAAASWNLCRRDTEKRTEGKPISASEVRQFLKEKQYTKIKELVPEQVYGILMKINGGWS